MQSDPVRPDEFYRRFFEEAPDMFASVDPATARITMCNQTLCDNLGYTKEQVIGRSIYSLYHKKCHTEVDALFSAFVNHGAAKSPHLVLERADGSEMDVSLAVSSHRDSDGNILESRSIWRDLSLHLQIERLTLELRLQDAQKMESLALLSGGIAHDFNNLLVAILGNASLGALELPNESPVQEKLASIVTAAQRAADLTRQLMAYSGSSNHEQTHFDLSKVVEEMGHLLEVAISRKVVLNFDLAHEPVQILGDITQVRQVIMNMLTNGSDAIGDRSGMITIRTGLQMVDQQYLLSTEFGQELEPGYFGFLEISDTGTGISMENQKKMFDPFYTTKSKGHGLGLAAVLGIVRSHRGTLRVYSEPGNGTTMKVLLPAANYTKPDMEDAEEPRRGHSEHILVVDDEEHVRAVAKQVLEHYGFRVSLCADGKEALAYYAHHGEDVDVVLMDVTMPHVDGIAGCKALSESAPDARVVLMSGHHEQQATNALAGRSFAGFVQKPFLPSNLLRAIVSALDGRTQA